MSGRTSARKAKSKLIRKRSGFNMFASEELFKGTVIIYRYKELLYFGSVKDELFHSTQSDIWPQISIEFQLSPKNSYHFTHKHELFV